MQSQARLFFAALQSHLGVASIILGWWRAIAKAKVYVMVARLSLASAQVRARQWTGALNQGNLGEHMEEKGDGKDGKGHGAAAKTVTRSAQLG
jgi:hypothetical protein